MFPVFLELNGKCVLVVGGGAVGQRKALAARAAGAKVRLVCLEPRPAELVDEEIDWRTEAYRKDHLDAVVLAFAAGPPGVNAQVVADARTRGIWVNVASEPETGDFHVPAVLRRGDLVVAIATGGAAPALARRLRQRLETEIDESFAAWVMLLAEMRPMVLARGEDEERRRELFEQLTEWGWLQRVRTDGVEAVRQAMQEMIESLLG